jgi:hypothetical protein
MKWVKRYKVKDLWKRLVFVDILKKRVSCMFRNKKKASYLHHTATTAYLCCVPALEDSAGAGCVGLARCKDTTF